MNSCVVIPHYNSRGAVRGVLERLAALGLGLPVLVVDDGSRPDEKELARKACDEFGATLVERAVNGGKGAAVKTGFLEAQRRGFTHALQVDADGQHRIEDAPAFLEASRRDPAAMVLCAPRYGADVPKGRLIGRQISRFWVWVETLSFAISDPLVGYRVYPLEPCVHLVESGCLGDRMEFDLQVVVRLRWRGLHVVNLPSEIEYPEGGVSHFRMLADNAALSGAHTRLVLGMLWRAPWILLRRAAP